MRLGVAFFAVIVAALVVGSCSSAPAAPTVTQAWARPATAGAESAAYMTITSVPGLADALMSASSPGAEKVELHEVVTDAGGMTGMKPMDHLDVHAGDVIELKPGGTHLMITGLKNDLTVGGKLELDLVFENAGRVVVQAEIRQG